MKGLIRGCAAVAALVLLGACNTPVPYKDVYDGLLPAGHKLQDAPSPLPAGQLKSKTVVLVTTSNFEAYTKAWVDYWEKGSGAGATAGLDQMRRSSDPRQVVVRVSETLRPAFKDVKAASDFAQAIDMKADYIALIDYYGTFNEMGDRYRTRGGVYFLDGSLRRVFQAEGSADVARDDGGLLGGTQGVYRGTAQAYARTLEITLGEVLTQTRARLPK